MKRILTAVAVLAVAHLLGVAGVIGWLAGTQRVDSARVEAIRQILREPIPEELARLEQEAREAAEALAGQPEPLPGGLPVASEMLVRLENDQQLTDELRAQRMERETTDLARTMTLERQRLDRDRAQFEAERERFEQMRARLAATEGAEQFKAALSVLREVKPADARAMLQQIIDGQVGALGAADDGMTGTDRAVAYLDALGSMERGEIMAQFAKTSPEVAAELLERLRTFGLLAEGSGAQTP